MCSSQGGETKTAGEVPAEAENSHPSSGNLSLRLFCLVEGDDSVFLKTVASQSLRKGKVFTILNSWGFSRIGSKAIMGDQ